MEVERAWSLSFPLGGIGGLGMHTAADQSCASARRTIMRKPCAGVVRDAKCDLCDICAVFRKLFCIFICNLRVLWRQKKLYNRHFSLLSNVKKTWPIANKQLFKLICCFILFQNDTVMNLYGELFYMFLKYLSLKKLTLLLVARHTMLPCIQGSLVLFRAFYEHYATAILYFKLYFTVQSQ